jgi:CRP-like cAMP-binding protein
MSRLARLFRKVERFESLAAGEKAALESAFSTVRRLHPHQHLFQEGSAPDGVKLITEGIACRYKMLPDGRRQIVGILLPGDICDVRAYLLDRMDYSTGSFGPVEVAVAPPEEMQAVIAKYPRITRAMWWTSLVDESIAREWMVNIGHRSAFERMAHLFCELFHRFDAVGLQRESSIELPLTQIDLADSLALSPVHVNRTLMELRRAQLLSFHGGVFTVHDFAELQSVASFDPRYLHLGKS